MKSAISVSLSSSNTWVPTGTLRTMSLALGAVAVLAHAMGAGRGLEVLLVAVVDQRVEPVDALDDDVAAAPAIAAVGAAELDELLAQERHAAGAAVAGADIDLGLVEKFHGLQVVQGRPRGNL